MFLIKKSSFPDYWSDIILLSIPLQIKEMMTKKEKMIIQC